LKNFNVPEVFQVSFPLQNHLRIPKDQLTDKPERFFVNETIRENIIELQ
jgi:GTP-binding protein Era